MTSPTNSFQAFRRIYRSLLLPALLGPAFLWGDSAMLQNRLLVFDDFYQYPREDGFFEQGVARGPSPLRNRSNFYTPAANAIPNGTFVMADLLADHFQVRIGREPISAEMLQGVDAYMMVCPIKPENGGRADLFAKDADVLREWVEGGGMLILVANSSADFEKSPFNFRGLNLIGRQFGLEFLESETGTVSIPIPPGNPYFDDVRQIIYGNGAILRRVPDSQANVEFLLEIPDEQNVLPVAALALSGRGRVLFLGDGGTLGNAHAFRSDIGQADAVRQLLLAILPDGPAPHYNWKKADTLKVEVTHEQILSAYPEFADFFRLPHHESIEVFSSGMREVDLENAPGSLPSSGNRDFVSIVSKRSGHFEFECESAGDHGVHGQWRDESGGSIPVSLASSGRFLSLGRPTSEQLTEWQHVLLHEAILAPLRSYAQPGMQWSAKIPSGLPQLQMNLVPRVEKTEAAIIFIGEEILNGQRCFLFERRTRQNGENWKMEDFFDPSAALPFSEIYGLDLLTAGQTSVARYWIGADSLLPVRTEVDVSGAVWWRDPRFPDRYQGSHDSKNYESWKKINFVTSIGRKLTVQFSQQ